MSLTITFATAENVRRAYMELNPSENVEYPVGEHILMRDLNYIWDYFVDHLESEDPAADYSVMLRRQMNNCESLLMLFNSAFDTYAECLDQTKEDAVDFVSDQTRLYNKILVNKYNIRRRLALFNYIRGRRGD